MGVSIYEGLSGYRVDELKDLTRLLAIKNYSKLKKQELIEKIAERILDIGHAELMFLLTEDSELELFEEGCNSEVIVDEDSLDDCVFLHGKGYLYVTEDMKLMIPDEVKELYKELNTKEFKVRRDRFQDISDYCRATTNLYGIISVEKLVEIFNEQNGISVTAEEIMDICEGAAIKNDLFGYHDGNIVDIELTQTEEYEDLLEAQGDKEYYVPEKEELLKYKDDLYFEETEEFSRMKKCILDLGLTKNESIAEEVCISMEAAITMGAQLEDLLDEFDFRGVTIKSRNQVDKMLPHMSRLMNNTRVPWNRGYTPNELSVMSGESKIIQFPGANDEEVKPKVGRNEPCPCGSGKKYKACCGK